ncbi:MAG: hypothetical protein WBD74_00670 [Candidatus Aquilonibacter sp.]
MLERSDALEFLVTVPVDTLIGKCVEDYVDMFGVDDYLRRLLPRFLASAPRANRDVVLQTLCRDPESARGLEADVLLLHMQGKDADDNTGISAAHYLHDMAIAGSGTARRILGLLRLDDLWTQDYGWPMEPESETR